MTEHPSPERLGHGSRLLRRYALLYVLSVWPAWGAAKLGWIWHPYAALAVLIFVACCLHVGAAFDRVRPYRWYGRVGLPIIHLVMVTVSVMALERGSQRESVLALVVLIGPVLILLDTARRLREGAVD